MQLTAVRLKEKVVSGTKRKTTYLHVLLYTMHFVNISLTRAIALILRVCRSRGSYNYNSCRRRVM